MTARHSKMRTHSNINTEHQDTWTEKYNGNNELHPALKCIFHANSNLLLCTYEPWDEQFFAHHPNKPELSILFFVTKPTV
jgi:hypothetical protein